MLVAMFRQHPFLAFTTFAYLALVGWVTLRPDYAAAGDSPWLWRGLAFFSRYESTDWITYTRVEFGANILMFVPVGMFLLLLFGRRQWYLSLLQGFALTCAIEFTQRYIPGRVSDVGDIIANTLGAFVGIGFVLVVTAPKARRMRADARRARYPTREFQSA
jgi:glycopeptide antibiotics resistance protein